MLTDADKKLIADLDAAEKLATPGEWSVIGPYKCNDNVCFANNFSIDRLRTSRKDGKPLAFGRKWLSHDPMSDHDARFINLSRNSARPLLDIIARLEAENTQLRAYAGNEIFASDYQTAGAMRQRIEHLEAEVARLKGEGE